MIHIEPYTDAMEQPVQDFNRRLNWSGTRHYIRLPETSTPGMLNGSEGFFQECFLAVENGLVRGGYIHYHQTWSVAGEPLAVGNAMRPISEGVIDPAYATVGLMMIQHSLRREPLQFALGLDGPHEPIAKLLRALRWDLWPVPFYFRVLNGRRFFRRFQPLRANWATALLMDAAAVTGLAWAGVQAASLPSRIRRNHGAEAQRVDYFPRWTDRLWEEARHAYSMLEWRDRAVLNELFAGRPEIFCLEISVAGRILGWAVLDRVTSGQKMFGGLAVYSILDCLALPPHAEMVIDACTGYLGRMGADLIISYQTHPAWREALRRAGFVRRRSSFMFASSPGLTKRMHAADPTSAGLHFTRAGGDVPVAWNVSRPMPTLQME